MKRFFLILSVFWSICAFALSATEVVDGIEWKYQIIGEETCIYGESTWNGEYFSAIPPETCGEIRIPKTLGGYPVTSISSGAFYCCTKLTSIEIPDSIICIGENAFKGCSGLYKDENGIQYESSNKIVLIGVPKSITGAFSIPATTRFIESNAFNACTGLISVMIPEGVISIGKWAFYNCSSLTSVTIPSSMTLIGDWAFYNCSSLTSVTIPSSVTLIGDWAFDSCSSLTSVTISEGVTSIGRSAFQGCSSLTSVTIPSSVTSIEDMGAFANCSSLTSVYLSDGLSILGENMFYNCTGLTSITIPEGFTTIPRGVFSGCTNLKVVNLPESLRAIDRNAFYSCSALKTIELPLGLISIGDDAFNRCYSLTEVLIPDSVVTLGMHAFLHCKKLKKIKLSENLKLLHHGVLHGCNALESITIPSGVRTIGTNAFANCYSLTSIVIPNSVTEIHESAFQSCHGLTSISLPQSVTSIKKYAFYDCKNLTDISIPKNVKTIGEQVYANCTSLTSITLPFLPDITSMGYGLFDGCTGLTSVTIAEGVTSIGNWAFENCSSLTSVTIPSSVTSIGDGAFYGCSSLTSVTIPEGVTSIGLQAFFGCSNLTSATLPEGVTTIGRSAFQGCSSLTSVTIPSSVTSIEDGAFTNCSSLTSVTIPEGVTSIGRSAFQGCSSLTSVTIPSSVTSIGHGAFEGCINLNVLTFESNPPKCDFNNLLKDLPKSTIIIYPLSAIEPWQTTIMNLEQSLQVRFLCVDLEKVQIQRDVISTVTSWSSKMTHWILGDVIVKKNGGALTIAPGAIVKFFPGARLIVEDGATVVANGVTFTHLYDMSVGLEDSNLWGDKQAIQYDYQVLGEIETNSTTLFKYYDFEQPFYLGTLQEDTIFTRGSVFIVSNTLTIPKGRMLTIEAGAIVKFISGASLVIAEGGTCNAQGAIFTHINDDTIGGDTRMDGGERAPRFNEYAILGDISDDEATEYRYMAVTNVSGTITSNATWRGKNIYRITSNVTIRNGVTLTIAPGCIVKFDSGCSITVNGTLDAQGTRAAPIIFTSIKDDSVGGDTNGDGDKTMPQPGDWVKIGVNGGTANFDFTHILYSSKNSTTGAINMNGGTVTFSNGEIAHGMYDAVGVESGHFYMTNSIIRDHLLAFRHWPKDPIVNCVIYDCGRLTQGGGQTFINCIFSNIVETWEAFGFPNSTYRNCVFWNEGGSVLTAEGKQDALTVCGQNGNIWGDPLFVDPMNGDFRIVEGSPCVDAADSTVAPEEDYYGQPRITMTEQEEGAEQVGQLADIGICEVMPRDITSDIDLVPLSVRTASEAKVGELLFVKWEVQNVGGAEVSTAWRDTILLVSESGRTVTLGEKVAGNQIAAGGTVFCSGYFVVPAIEEGTWYVKVNVNSYRDIFEGSLTQNNALTGDRPITLSLDALDANATNRGVVDANSPKVLKFTYDEGDTNRMMTVKVPAGVKVTWGFGFVPQGAANSGITVAGTEGATFRIPEEATDVYVVIESDTTIDYEVSTESTQMVVTSVYPTTLPSSGTTTLTITGAGFDKASSIVLSTGGKDYALEPFVQNAMGNLVATVDCATLQAGAVYTLTVSDENNAASLTNAISVTKAEGKGKLNARLIVPNSVRQGRITLGYIEYENTGMADMSAPVFRVCSNNPTTLVGLSNDSLKMKQSVRCIGIGAEYPHGVLKSGTLMRMPFYFVTYEGDSYSLELKAFNPECQEVRDSIFPTWDEFTTAIGRAATVLNSFGVKNVNYSQTYNFAMRQAYGDFTGILGGRLVNVNEELPMGGMELGIFDSEKTLIATCVTDSNGYFCFDALKEGEVYTLCSKTCQVERELVASEVHNGIVYAAPLGEAHCILKDINIGEVKAITLTCQEDGKEYSMAKQEDSEVYSIGGLPDGTYVLNAQFSGYYYLDETIVYEVNAGLISNNYLEITPKKAGCIKLFIQDRKLNPVVRVRCCLWDKENNYSTSVILDENGMGVINCPSGSYALTLENGYSFSEETIVEVVNGTETQCNLVADRIPFMLSPPAGVAPLKVVAQAEKFSNVLSYMWDFENDGIWDAEGATATNNYTNVALYDVSLKVVYDNGVEEVFTNPNAVEVWEKNIVEYKEGALLLNDKSGFEIIERASDYLVLRLTEVYFPVPLEEGMTIVDPQNLLQPYKILDFEVIEKMTVKVYVKATTLENAYKTLQMTSLYSVDEESECISDESVASLLRKTIPLNDGKTVSGECSFGVTARTAVNLSNGILNYLSISTTVDVTANVGIKPLEFKPSMKGNTLRRYKKTRPLNWTYPIPGMDMTVLVGYMPYRLAGKFFINGTLGGEVSVTHGVTQQWTYKHGKGWNYTTRKEPSNLQIKGEGSCSAGIKWTLGIGVGRMIKSGGTYKDYGFNLADIELEVGVKGSCEAEWNPSELIADKVSLEAGVYFSAGANILHLMRGDWDLTVVKTPTIGSTGALLSWSWETPIPSFTYEYKSTSGKNYRDVVFQSTTFVKEDSSLISREWDLEISRVKDTPLFTHRFYCHPKDKVYYTIYLREQYKPNLKGAQWLPTFVKAKSIRICIEGKDYDDDDDDPSDNDDDDDPSDNDGDDDPSDNDDDDPSDNDDDDDPSDNDDDDPSDNDDDDPSDNGGEESNGGSEMSLGGARGTIPQSCDPNEMVGPRGIGNERYIQSGDWMTYTVYFENKSDATAAAQEVRVTNPLSQYLDWSTFEMGEVAFNNQIDLGLSGKQTGASEVALNNTAYKVKTTVALDQTKGEVNWYLRIVDPSTETTWPEDVYAGILPPNDETHRGEGHLTYRVKVREDVPAGVRIDNSATIIFDYNEPIETDPAWWNRVVPSQVPMSISPEATLVDEGETIEVKVFGGDLTRPSSAQVYLSYHTAAAADLDLAKATVTGVNQTAPSRTKLAFPLTLNWATGEVGEQTIRIPVKTDKAVEDEETFTLQLANPENMALGSKQVCMVTLHDTNAKELKAAVTPYKPKPGESPVSHQVTVGRNDGAAGFVAGSGEYTAGSKLTLTAEARPGYAFVGWALKEDLENLLSTNPKYQIVVGEDGDYVAVFEPIPYVRGLATPAEGGKVTGSGYCADGKKVTLKARANKNFVFKGWYAASVENPQTPDAAVCVATTPSLVIDRTAKPTANSKTSTTLTDIDEDVTFFALFEGDPRLGLTMMPESAGKVTGAGRYLPGTKVTLKATPNKGYVFAGWYQDEAFTMPCESMLADYRNPSYTYVTGAADATLHACFVPAEEDQVLTLTVQNKANDEIAETFTINGKAEFALLVDSKSLPKVSVKGLPAGMKFTATPVMEKGSKTKVEYPINTIYGTPTKPGVYTVTVSLTNSTIKKAITKTFEINVLNFTDELIQIADSYGPYTPGVSYTVPISAAEGCTVSGLPAGMKWTAKDIYKKGSKTEIETPANSVYGIPTTPGNYTVYFTKTVDKVKHTATATFKVGPYPQLNVMVSDGGVGGKVTGAGDFAANKKVTLKATPNTDYVFAGWYKDSNFDAPCDSTLMDYRNPSYTYVMGTTNKTFHARFVAKEEDNWLELMVNDEEIWNETGFGDILTFEVFGESEFNFELGSESLPKATVTGLPTGMKFTATPVMVKGSKTEVEYPANTIYGTPTKPGIYTVKVALTNTTITKAITKTFNIKVPNLKAPGVIDVYDCYGEYVPGVSYIEEVPEAEGCTVTGLPAGMKWTAKDIVDLKTKEVTVPANSVYGIPTTPGNYTVYFTKTVDKVKYTATATFKVGPYPQLTVDVPVCTDGTIGGKVTGAGGFAANKTATLRATPNKGYVFAGWYEDEFFTMPCDSTLVDYRNPSYTYVMGTTNKTFHARFVAKEEDNWLELMVNDEEIWNETGFGDILTFEVFGESEFNFELGSESLPKATVTGLPTGMKFTATPVMVKGSKTEVEYPANTIYGTPTKPGIYTVKVALTNTTITKAITKTFNIKVPNLKAPGVIDVYDCYGEYVPGVSYIEEVPEAEGCTVTGLPAGMKWTAKDIVDLKTKEVTVPANSVYGIPTTPGNYTVYFTKTVDKVKYTATATFKVGPYPQLNVMVSDDGVGGKVTGAGVFAANKTATLRATPNKGYVFAGWYKDGYPCDSTLVDYRTPSYTYVMGEDDTQFYARFVTKDEEADYEMGIELIDEYYNSLGDDVQVRAGEVMEPVKVWVDSLTLPTVTVTGLPTGLKFDAKTFTISGKPTKPGFYPISIEAKNASKSRSVFAIVNLEVRHFNAHGLHGDWEDAEPIVIDAFTTELFDLEDWFGGFFDGISIKSLTLPVGLIYNATTGEIKGNGTLKCGSHTVTLTDKAGQVTTFTLVAELDEADMFTYEDYFTPNEEWGGVYNGVVQGTNTDIWWISILKCKEESENWWDWDRSHLDMATAQALSVKVTGLPSGLRASFEKYCSEEKTYECDIYLEGKTSAAPGDYPVTVTISNSRTGQVEHVSSVIRIFPAPSIQMKKKFTLEADDYYDENGKPLEAHAEVTYTINGISGTAAYKVTMERPNGKQFTTSGSLPLNDIFVTATVPPNGHLEYSYYFYTATSIAEADIGITLNEDGVVDFSWAWFGYTEDYSFSWYPW